MLWGSLAAPPGESLVTQRRLFCSRRSSFSARCSSSTLTRSLRQHLLLWSARAHLAAAASAAQRAACRAAGRAFPHSCRTAARRVGCRRRCAAQAAVAHRQAHSGPGGASRCEGMCTCFVFSKPTENRPPCPSPICISQIPTLSFLASGDCVMLPSGEHLRRTAGK